MSIQSADSETSGLDFHFGVKPFLFTFCDEEGNQSFWEADVDPLTRQPQWSKQDLEEVEEQLNSTAEVVMHNAKFDIKAIESVGIKLPKDYWSRVRDTLMSAHLLNSSQSHDLTSCALVYLRVNIMPFEEAIKAAVNKARSIAKSKYPDWRLAKKGDPMMPSLKDSAWQSDMWLPRAIAKAEKYPEDHPWWTVLSEYANSDSAVTLPLYLHHRQMMKEMDLWEIYLERLKLLPVIYKMEMKGVTISEEKLAVLEEEYRVDAEKAGKICVNIAKSMGHELVLPKSGNNHSLLDFCFGKGEEQEAVCGTCQGTGGHQKGQRRMTVLFGMGVERLICTVCGSGGRVQVRVRTSVGLDLPVLAKSELTGKPSLDKLTITKYAEMLPKKSKPLTFIKSLMTKRRRDTALNYTSSYRDFWLPTEHEGWRVLHPSLNPTGTTTLRMSSSNPNAQNISKSTEVCKSCDGDGCEECDDTGEHSLSLRYPFGPAPGREWWSLDYENVELRIPAYESGEKAMIELFERPNDPPYFGSYHLMNASIIYPEYFWPLAEKKGAFKEKYKSTWYQWVKNFGFACSYGAQKETADKAAHKAGSFDLVKSSLKEHSKLTNKYINFANRFGYVETIPDKTVNPRRGYPVYCSRSAYGRISPTVPLAYHVQSSAMYCTGKSMVRVDDYLERLTRQDPRGYFMVLQVHDECVFDFPAGGKKNLPKIQCVQQLMEQVGDDVGIPLKVAITWNPDTWGEGKEVE
jgi:DNA polymerase I-like protein with 3'-5' exonuclease and polymerase domains